MSATADKLVADLIGATKAFGKRAEAASGLPRRELDAVGFGPEIESAVVARLHAALSEARQPVIVHEEPARRDSVMQQPNRPVAQVPSPQAKQLRHALTALIADGLVPYNIAERGGVLLDLAIVSHRVSLPDSSADEAEHDAAYANALVAVLKEAVKDRLRSGKYRRLLRDVLPLRDEYVGRSVKERRTAAGKNLTKGKKVVKPDTIRTYYEPKALEKLAEALAEMEGELREDSARAAARAD